MGVLARPAVRSALVLLAYLLAIVGIFVADLLTARETTAQKLYGVVILASLLTGRLSVTLALAALCSVLIPVGWFLSPLHAPNELGLFNSGVALLLVWLTTGLVLGVKTKQLQRANHALRDANDRLVAANAALEQEMAQRKEAEAALSAAEQKFATTFQSAPVGVALITDRDGRHVEVNTTLLNMLGYTRDAMVGRTAEELGLWQDGAVRERVLAEVRHTGWLRDREVALVRGSGEVFPALLGLEPVGIAGERMLVATVLDITERKRLEAALRATLTEKEAALATNQALLREVNHRVKNNLQMLCDMLYLQMEGLADHERQAVLRETYGRIYTIARLHEQLYQTMQSGQIPLSAYLGRLVAGFEDLYPGVSVTLDTAPADLALDVDRAIHVGLIVNELVTNAMKHGFPGRQDGRVDVRLSRTGEHLELQVRDNGVGLPAHFDPAQAKTLGLRIIRILAQRLYATVNIENQEGAVFAVRFPVQAEAAVGPRDQ